jgi:hypothetical protein
LDKVLSILPKPKKMNKSILLVTACADSAVTQIHTDRFLRDAKQGLSDARSDYEPKTALAANIDDFYNALERYRPNILHLVGHGDRLDRFMFEDLGENEPAKARQLAEAIKNYDSIECIIISACHSGILAKLLLEKIPYVIAYDGALSIRLV